MIELIKSRRHCEHRADLCYIERVAPHCSSGCRSLLSLYKVDECQWMCSRCRVCTLPRFSSPFSPSHSIPRVQVCAIADGRFSNAEYGIHRRHLRLALSSLFGFAILSSRSVNQKSCDSLTDDIVRQSNKTHSANPTPKYVACV